MINVSTGQPAQIYGIYVERKKMEAQYDARSYNQHIGLSSDLEVLNIKRIVVHGQIFSSNWYYRKICKHLLVFE